MALSAYGYRPGQEAGLPFASAALLVGGLFLLGALILARGRTDTYAKPPRVAFRFRNRRAWHWLAVVIGALCLLLMADATGPIPGRIPQTWGMAHDLQFILWLIGLILVTWGMAGARFIPRRHNRLFRELGTPRREWLLVMGMTILAFVLRVVALEDAVHLYIDETHFINAVNELHNRPDVQLLSPISNLATFTYLYSYFQAISVDLFGASLAGARMASVIIGTMTIPAIVFLGKQVFDKSTALTAGLLLAVFPPHIHFSRLALNNIGDALLGSLALAFLIRAMREGRRADYALAGLCLGMTQYFYEGGRLLLPILVLLWLVIVSFLTWIRESNFFLNEEATIPEAVLDTPPFAPSLNGFFTFLLTMLLVGAPLYYALDARGASLLPRLNQEGVTGNYWVDILIAPDGFAQLGTILSERLLPPLQHFVHSPDGSAFYYGGATALILPALVPLFLLGLWHALWRWRFAGGLLLLWLILTVLGNSLIEANDWTARFVVAFPAVILLLAWGLRATWNLILGDVVRWRRVATIAFGSLLAVIAVRQALYYFGEHLPLYNQQIRPFHDHQDVGFRAADFPPGTQVYLLTDDLTYAPHVQVMFRLMGVQVDIAMIQPFVFPYERAHTLPSGVDYAFFIVPEDGATLWRLRRVYGDRLEGPYFSPYNVPQDKQYALYYVRAEQPQ